MEKIEILKRRFWRRLAMAGTVALPLLLPGCYGMASAPQPAISEMHGHFQAAADLRTAAIFGDLDALRRSARSIHYRGSVAGIPEAQTATLFDLRQQAREIEESTGLDEAMHRVPLVFAACGACHEAAGLDLTAGFALTVPPEAEVLTDPHGQSLSWAVNRLWEGLIGPSDIAWAAGADALSQAQAPAWPAEIKSAVGDPDRIDQASAELARMGDRAASLDRPEARVHLLRLTLRTCADCHTGLGR